MAHVYISHSPVDLDPLLQLHEALRRAGIADWYPTSPEAASNTQLISRQLDDAMAMVVLVSADSIRSRAVQVEIEMAKARGVPIVPYALDKARLGGVFKTDIAPVLKHHADTPGALDALIEDVRNLYRSRCPVLSVMNLKGGVGKTTLTAQVFGTLQAQRGSRILLIDLDPQYNLTQVFFDMETADARANDDRSVISLFEKSRIHATDATSPAIDWARLSKEPFNPAPLNAITCSLLAGDGPPGRLDLISGQFEISKYAFATDSEALAAIKANFIGQIEALRSVYDLIVFDTNPNATFLTECALEASDRVLAPMHPDVYSLRGVRLLNQVINTLIAPDQRPALSVIFNAVHRREQSTFEADARNGVFDEIAGFRLSAALLGHALPRSAHLVVDPPEMDTPAWQQLVIHNGRGGGLRAIRDELNAIGNDIRILLETADLKSQRAA